MSKLIMIVDDDRSNLAVLQGFLEPEYEVVLVTSAESALKRLDKLTPDLILLDNKMPGMSGIELMDLLKRDKRLRSIPVIFLTAEHEPAMERECFVHGAADFIAKPYVASVLLERVKKAMEFWELQHRLEEQVSKKTQEVESVILQSITAIANTIDAKDSYTKGHSERVAEYSAVIAREMGWKDEEIQLIYNIALLHDIGKIGIPDAILNKPGRLSDYEFSIIKQHTITGGEILKDIHSMQNAFIAAKYHHERYDGKGYPSGLKGEEIPLFARVIAVADAYDAMTSNRVYRKKLSNDIVLQELEKGKGTQFDPNIANIFIDILKRNQGSIEDPDSEELRVAEMVSNQQRSEEYLSTHDCISGLYKNDYVPELLKQIPAKEEYTFCLVGISNFDRINHVYGRIQGDYVLQSMAGIFNELIDEKDFAYRINGAKFGICLRNQSDMDFVEVFAKKVIDKFHILQSETAVMETADIAIGISRTITDGKDFKRIYRNADCAYYHAKIQRCGFWTFKDFIVEIPMTERGVGRLERCLFSEDARKQYNVTGNQNLIARLDDAAEFIKEYGKPCYLVLFELVAVRECIEDDTSLVEAMNLLEISVIENIKEQDKGMRFSSSQYLMIMQYDDAQVVEKHVERISRQYYRMNSSKKFELEFGIERTQKPVQ